jgi:hypothetical protein
MTPQQQQLGSDTSGIQPGEVRSACKDQQRTQRGLILKFKSCEMCDALVVVADRAGHGFCSAACRHRYEVLGDKLDLMVADIRGLRDRSDDTAA